MSDLPPSTSDPRRTDADHLKLLAIFHFILAGFALAALGFLFLHWLIMHTLIFNPETQKNAKSGPPPAAFFIIFNSFYLFVGAGILTMGLGNVVSGWCLITRRARMFSLVMAGINCLGFPFGTILGVFTFIVLFRDSVTALYSAKHPPVGGQVA